MKKAFFILAALALAAGGCKQAPKQQKTADTANTLADSRDGKKYKTVKIGEQVWMAENLSYEAQGSRCYGEGGEVITEFDSDEGPIATKTLTDKEIQANCARYGRLYNWSTAKGACPAGWHLPSDAEWDVLAVAVGGVKDEDGDWQGAGKKLKSTSGWNNNGNGTDEFGFSALPGGSGEDDGSFERVGEIGYWWSATQFHASIAWSRYMHYGHEGVNRYYSAKWGLYSVRCVKDTDEQTAAEKDEAGVIDFEKLTLKGDVYYLNNAPFTGKTRKEEDCCTEEWEMKGGRFHGKYSGDFPNSGATGTYKDGKKHGEWKELSDGADSYGGYKVGTYKDDKKHGEWKYFNFEDEFKGTETWENGVLIKEWTAEKLPTLTPSETVEFASEAPNAEDAYGFKDDPNGEYYHFGSFVSDGDTQWDGFSYSEKFTATSTLAPQGKVSYNAKNLENNTKVGGIRGTTWCEGANGHGTGERITMGITTRGLYKDEVSFYQLLIVNGFARNAATWKNNTRVKTLRLYIGGKAWCDLKLSDVMKPQIFTLPDNLYIVPAKSGKVIDKGDPSAERVSGVGNFPTYQTDLTFEIIEVYPGDKYDDTCITGIALGVASGGVY